MTDLQIKAQTLRETERSNLVNEGLKKKDVESKSRLNESQVRLNDQQIVNLQHEVDLIIARTDLTKAQKAEAVSQTVLNFAKSAESATKAASNLTGLLGNTI